MNTTTRAVGAFVFVEFMRLSLYERPQSEMFERRTERGSRYTREQWLRYIFSAQHEFSHRGSKFTFVPDKELSDDSVVTGRIGRERLVRDNEPPEQGMHERVHPEWQASVVVIDPRPHEDGQKVAMQHKEEIGKPVPVFQSLVSKFNADRESPYTVEAFGIVDPETFWDFVRENSGDVVSVTFEAVAPNMFSGKDDFENELRELRDKEKSQKTKVELTNDQGLAPDTERMHQVADYTLKGGGAIKARTKKKKRYNSRHKTKRQQIPEPSDPETLGQHVVRAVKDLLHGLFNK
jgi:hypothetical protein